MTGWPRLRRTAGRRCPSMSARSTTSPRRCSRPASTTRPSCGRKRPGRRSTSRRSARRPASASRPTRPIRITTHRASPIATCWSSAAARRALRRRSPRRKAARASSCATSRPSSAARCATRAGARSTGPTAGPGHRRPSRSLPPWTNVRLLPRTTAFGYYAQNFVGLVERVTDHLAGPTSDAPRERLWQVRARRVVLATGAIERHMVFADNDRPGVMLASAARTYLNHYGVAVGRNVGVFTANDSAYHAAIDLKKAGVGDRGHRRSARQSVRPGGRAGARARHRDQSRPRRGRRWAASCASRR